MTGLPETRGVAVACAYFLDEATWTKIRAELSVPVEGTDYVPEFEFSDLPELEGATAEQIDATVAKRYPSQGHPLLVVVDEVAMRRADHAVLLIDLSADSPSRPFRAIPAAVGEVEGNLAIANLDFEDFAASVHADGVYRGFEDELDADSESRSAGAGGSDWDKSDWDDSDEFHSSLDISDPRRLKLLERMHQVAEPRVEFPDLLVSGAAASPLSIIVARIPDYVGLVLTSGDMPGKDFQGFLITEAVPGSMTPEQMRHLDELAALIDDTLAFDAERTAP